MAVPAVTEQYMAFGKSRGRKGQALGYAGEGFGFLGPDMDEIGRCTAASAIPAGHLGSFILPLGAPGAGKPGSEPVGREIGNLAFGCRPDVSPCLVVPDFLSDVNLVYTKV
jgi:hypothetical protein